EAAARGMRPTLAGRDANKLRPLADELQLPLQAFALDDAAGVAAKLEGCALALNCAGPFSQTAGPMIEACLMSRTHYLDITGEIDVIEGAAAQNEAAAAAGVVLLPAVGFDVAPTDCLAALLAAKAPSATHLELAFNTPLETSPGTTKSIVETIPRGGRVRRGGKLVRVPHAWRAKEIPFADATRWAATVPWGDVASAYYSTGIGDIEVYLGIPKKQIASLRWLRWIAPLVGVGFLQRLWKNHITRTVRGPSAAQRRKTKAQLWGRVTDGSNTLAEATIETPNAYTLTVQAAVAAVERVLATPPAAGFQTPSRAFGADFVLQFPDVTLHWRHGEANC
ncbi:MAG: hypothetical protein KDA41_10430, partial [Planctomycetales bacterium]|nr:hypothetical protein [Planctomycetales bacterium]